MATVKELRENNNGDAVVEATILFPILIMIFAALVLLSVYLPTRAALQRSTQYTATALSTELSDTWLFYDAGLLEYYRENDKSRLGNVYTSVFSGAGNSQGSAEEIVANTERRIASYKTGELMVDCYMNDKTIYSEIVVTATREIRPPVDLSFVGFPGAIEITVTSTAVVQDGDEFVRNVDLVVYFADFIAKRFGLSDAGGSIGSLGSRFKAFIGG